MNTGWRGVWLTIGPGVVYAAAAVGTSHLIQSTRAGADYGYSLIGLLALTFVFKYPAFEYSCRYTTATGRSLLQGYLDEGRWALGLFLAIILASSVIAVTVLTAVTAALAGNLLGPVWPGGRPVPPVVLNLGILGATVLLVGRGRYAVLDRAMKGMMSALAAVTLVAVVLAFRKPAADIPMLPPPELWSAGGIAFMLAFMGWMPTPVDASAFTSIWLQKRIGQTGHHPTLKEALVDFNIGFVSSAVLALAFLLLGARVMYGTGEQFSPNGVVFAGQLAGLYTRAIGEWGRWMVSFIAFVTLFSTVVTVFDGYALTLRGSLDLLAPRSAAVRRVNRLVFPALVVSAFVLCTASNGRGLKAMVDFAAVTAFLTAPVLAWLNLRAVTAPGFPAAFRPGRALQVLAWAGIAFLVAFGVVFLASHLGA
jgi:Mn2+/Fe2+ NRAMP family transporter